MGIVSGCDFAMTCPLHSRPMPGPNPMEPRVTAFDVLFSTDYGLMSVFVILFMLAMAVFFIRFFLKNMEREEKETRR